MAARVVLNNAAFRALRTDAKVVEDLRRRAQAVADAAGEGYVVGDAETPRNRARVAVIAASPEAQADNARNNTLLRSLDAGR